MEGGIFIAREDGRLSLLRKSTYNAEEILQKILADYPELLAGEQITPEQPRQWLLIAREFPVPDPEDGTARWSLDHLFVDQEGVPTLVEVKRSSDTRIRREVIAQMLEYAANSAAWRIEDVIGSFESTCKHHEVSPDERLAAFLGVERTAEEFWQSVRSNLGSARLRLLFVADEIPPQLQRIVEFLNNQMSSTEVLAVAVPQYVGDDGLTAYVPRLSIPTAQAQMKRSITRTGGVLPNWTTLDDSGVEVCLQQIRMNPHIEQSRADFEKFVKEFARMAADIDSRGAVQVLYRPCPGRGGYAVMRLATATRGSKPIPIVHCLCSPDEKNGVVLGWGIRELRKRMEAQPALLNLVDTLRNAVYASVDSEHRQAIRTDIETYGAQRTPLAWIPADNRTDIIEAIRAFCESLGGTPAD